MREEDELEMLLGEIPYATSSLNFPNHPTEIPNGTMYGMYYDDPYYHLKYTTHESPINGFSFSSDGSSSSILSNSNGSLSPPILEEIPSHGNTNYPKVGNVSDNRVGDITFQNPASELNLCDLVSGLCISNCSSNYRPRNAQNPPLAPNGFQFNGANRFNVDNFAHPRGIFLDNKAAHLTGFQFSDNSFYASPNNYEAAKANASYGVTQSPVLRNQQYRNGETHLGFPGSFQGMDYPYLNQFIGMNADNECLIIRGEGSNFVKKKEFGRSKPRNNYKSSTPSYDIGLESPRGRSFNPKVCSSPGPPPTYESLVEVQGYIPMIAKDQDGCRFLQKIFEERTPQDIQIIFGEIIGHVLELMVDPFGNYLLQKLLEVCNEEQRMQILLLLTEKPGQLIRFSFNTHGTRVVQKLIETLKTRQQVSLVISALEPGFLALVKDSNGNHVIKQCLHRLSEEDNKFIFVAISKYSIEVATNQHGCCVLQLCIRNLKGERKEKLVNEISSNGILLAQDEYGNFLIQYILDLEIPSVTSRLISQFEGNFVHLSTQKYSSHVVEKCLAMFDDDLRSQIIQELLSAPRFKELLLDPYANYVIGKAIKLTEGSRIYCVLIEAINCHESILRNCPYSKKLLTALKHYREATTSRKNHIPRSF